MVIRTSSARTSIPALSCDAPQTSPGSKQTSLVTLRRSVTMDDTRYFLLRQTTWYQTTLMAVSISFARISTPALSCDVPLMLWESRAMVPASTPAPSAEMEGMKHSTSAANNLVPNDTNGCDDIFRKDLDTGAIVRCSTDATGLQGVSDSGSPVISYDGRYLGFCSRANNLVPSDENGSIYDVFRKDIETGAVVKCSTRADGSDDNNHSRTPSLSSDGRYITFVTTGELVKYPCLYEPYAYRKDVASGEIALCPATNEGILSKATITMRE